MPEPRDVVSAMCSVECRAKELAEQLQVDEEEKERGTGSQAT